MCKNMAEFLWNMTLPNFLFHLPLPPEKVMDASIALQVLLNSKTTRNTLMQASKNGRKPYLFHQKKNAFSKFHTFFSVLFTMFLVYHDLKQKLK